MDLFIFFDAIFDQTNALCKKLFQNVILLLETVLDAQASLFVFVYTMREHSGSVVECLTQD